MERKRLRLPTPSLVVAMLALFLTLGGVAAAAKIVPLAKRALVSDNSKKLGGRTAAQIIAAAAPKSASGLVAVKTAPWSLNPGQQSDFSVTCDAGVAISGGYDNPTGTAIPFDTRPDGANWRIYLANASDSAAASGNLFAVCLK
jgi:hypothetical protein